MLEAHYRYFREEEASLICAVEKTFCGIYRMTWFKNNTLVQDVIIPLLAWEFFEGNFFFILSLFLTWNLA